MIIKTLSITFIFLLSLNSNTLYSQDSFDLQVSILGIKEVQGNIRICVSDSEANFPDQCKYSTVVAIKSKIFKTAIKNIPKGSYAVSVMHDKNEDTEMNFNFLGMPTEKYGFSNNPPSMFGVPSFKKCLFTLDKHKEISIQI